MKCWAYGPDGYRCDRDDVHETHRHVVTYEWTDDEVLVPVPDVRVHPVAPGEAPVFEYLVPDEDMDCAACGCKEDQHEDCPHGCRQYV